MSIYTIDAEIKSFIDNLYNRTDENGEIIDVTEEDLKKISELQEDRKTKLENIVLYCKNLDAEATAIKAEIESLSKRLKRIETKSEGLKNVMIYSLVSNKEKEFESARCTAKIKEYEATDIFDQSILPKKYIKKIKPEVQYKPDKNEIKKALKEGKKVRGAQIIITRKLKID